MRWLFDRDKTAAEREFKTAIKMQPELASVHWNYGWFLAGAGRFEESIAESRRAVELEPLAIDANITLGYALYLARRYAEAIQQLRITVSIEPDHWWAHSLLGRAYARTGRYGEAIAELQTAMKLENPNACESESALARAYADAGDKVMARSTLAHMRERMGDYFLSDAYLATIHVGLGEIDEAVAALTRAEAQHSYYVGWWSIDPELDPVRADPRFIALMKKSGLGP